MRERRLDEDEAIVDLGKSLEAIKRDKELILRKVKIVEQSLSAIHQVTLIIAASKQHSSEATLLEIWRAKCQHDTPDLYTINMSSLVLAVCD